ncbi:hypothetical protein NQ317_002080 [Molorchus minor]|uniref:UBX domain-containing protein 4 n=1 Tax=Molorchus minor TaxID=1323400 RepID=A0ABQ9JNJ6_9CUCU|nr:hypothetical protein NQ317_002080 [Molorchus minor]
MKWYTGGIAEAIAVSKAKGAIFVVYIEGNDDQSKSFTSLINSNEISNKLENQYFIAIKIEAGSVPHQQFGEIFKQPNVPSIYFIGKNGTPLDIITEASDSQTLLGRIDNTLQKSGISLTSSAKQLSEEFIQTEQSTSQSNVVCDSGVCTIKRDTDASTSQGENSESVGLDHNAERIKELLQKKREENEERQKEYQKEIERRKMGQNVQQMKKWQEDQELKQFMEEREKEKRENQLARERVLSQIAQDKAERQAKLSNDTPVSESSKPQASSARSNATSTRLQFKLPDGRTAMQEFANSDTLQIVIAYIRENLNLPFSDFRLSTTFPRREFLANEYSQSLLDLELTPNAVILVLPVTRGTISTNQGGNFTNMIWSIFTPLFNIFGYLRNFIFGNGGNAVGNKNTTTGSPTRPEVPRQRPRDSTVIRRQGNVHRLTDRRDSDDESNTWNGNSTQQM